MLACLESFLFRLANINIVRDHRSILSRSLNIPTTELTVVLGHNGSGKSTLVNLLSGQMAPDSGQIDLNGTSLSQYKTKELAQKIAYLPQNCQPQRGCL